MIEMVFFHELKIRVSKKIKFFMDSSFNFVVVYIELT